jgi:hypothetical protein
MLEVVLTDVSPGSASSPVVRRRCHAARHAEAVGLVFALTALMLATTASSLVTAHDTEARFELAQVAHTTGR